MLSSRKTLDSRSLQSSASRTILLNQSGTGHRSSASLFSLRREFAWGPRNKDTPSRTETMCKGFSTQDLSGNFFARKQLYPSAFWVHHHLRGYLPRYAPVREWRFSSSWGKNPETPSDLRGKTEANEEEDWYTRWEKHKLRQYNDFMQKVEQDPYTALFGKSWLSFGGENTEPRAARTSSADSFKEKSMPKNERAAGNWPSKSKFSNTNFLKNRDVSGRRPNDETMPIQEHDQEYKIDPITNRKVLNPSASPISTSGHTKAQVKDGETSFEPFIGRRELASLTPLDHRSITVERAQVLSSSNPPSKDTPPLKPHESKGWLAQEGFRSFHVPKSDSQPTLQTHDAKPNATATKIESALDRHLSSKNTSGNKKRNWPQLQQSEENTREDVDLLRPSDVRASTGLRGNSPKETHTDKQVRRKKLEENYKSCFLDRTSHLVGEPTSTKLMQKGEDIPEEKDTSAELRFGSWSKGTLRVAELKSKDVSKGTSAVWVNEHSDARDFDPVSIDQTSDSITLSKNGSVSESSSAVGSEAQDEATGKANKLKAQMVPFKAKLDAMKADYEFLRQQWLLEIRMLQEKAAKKEEMKALKIAERAREIHEEEIKTQKVAMEAMEMRGSNRTTSTGKTSLARGVGNDDPENPTPRRLQSFLQGEGDMASNVHEFAGRDRWYKRKAPHAMDAKDAELEAKLQKVARDRALIREVRGIYEDTYGTIDTKHRQPQVDPILSVGNSGQPITSSPGTAARHTRLPSSVAGMMECPRGLNKSQISDALVIIQKLFGQLRETQSIIQDYQSQEKQALDPNSQDNNTFKTPVAFEKSVMQILTTSSQLARVWPSMISQDSVEPTVAANSKKPTVNRPPSTTAPMAVNLKVQKATKLNNYSVLAYDSVTESVTSVEATTLEPFSIEESLSHLDALNRLSNPGKFLHHVMSLGMKGYEPVAGTTSILVFKKKVTPQDLAGIKKTDVMQEPSPVYNPLDHSPVVADDSVGTQRGSVSFDHTSEEDIDDGHQAQIRKLEAEQQNVENPQKQTVEKTERKPEKMEEASKTATDRILKEKQPFEEAHEQHLASSASPSHTSSDTVHRQETVFSGSRQGRWVDNSVKFKRSKRAAVRGRKTMKRMFMASAFTAACCYCVGVALEMMHG